MKAELTVAGPTPPGRFDPDAGVGKCEALVVWYPGGGAASLGYDW